MALSFKKSTSSLAALTAFLLMVICGFNYYVNSYGIFPHRMLEHNQIMGWTNPRLVSAYNLKHDDYDGIIVGSSRGNKGIDPDSEYLQGRWYNASLPGASLTEIYYYIQHAFFNNRNFDTIILGLDYYLFKRGGKEFRSDFSLARLDTEMGHSINVKDSIDALFSIDSIQSNWYTFSTRNRPARFNKGFFISKNANNPNKTVTEIFTPIVKKITQAPIILDENKFETFNQILNFCHENKIRLIFYVHPYHQYTKSYFNFDSSSDEQLISKIAQANRLAAARTSNPAFDFWDFSNSNSITNLSFTDRQKLFEYYFEGSHYTPKTGDMILCKILNHQNCDSSGDFGRKILSH